MEEIIRYSATVIAAGFGAYLASYLKEKAKGLATKEDFDSILSQMEKTTRQSEEIRKSVEADGWLTKQQWERREKFYTEILTKLKQGEIAFSELNDYYKEPGSEHNDEKVKKSKRFISLKDDGHKALDSVRELSGASSLYLSDASNETVQKLFSDSWEAENSAVYHAEYIRMMHTAVEESYSNIRAEAIRNLRIQEAEPQR